jgi:hypothetical protein
MIKSRETSVFDRTTSLQSILNEFRKDDELPGVISKLGWRYHHIGIPTHEIRPDEEHLAQFKLFKSGFSTNPFGIEWMRFEPDCPLHNIIKTIPHVAFEVDDLDAALEGQEIIFPPGSPSDGVRSAMIVHQGAPIELISFKNKAKT